MRNRLPAGRSGRFLLKAIKIVIIILLFVLAVFAAARSILNNLKDSVTPAIENALNCRINARAISFSLKSGFILDEVYVYAKSSPGKPLLSADRITLEINLPGSLSDNLMIKKVVLEKPRIIVSGKKEQLKVNHWLKSLSSCDINRIKNKLPSQIEINKGLLFISGTENPSGSPITVTGRLTLTGETTVNVNMNLSHPDYGFDMNGTMKLCEKNNLSLKAVSEYVDFSKISEELMSGYKLDKSLGHFLPAGTGDLSISIAGDIAAPSISGAARSKDFDVSFSVADEKIRFQDFRAGIGREKLYGSGEIDYSDPALPASIRVYFENINASRLFDRSSPGLQPSGSVSGSMFVEGSVINGTFTLHHGMINATNGILKFAISSHTMVLQNHTIVDIPFRELSLPLYQNGDTVMSKDLRLKGPAFDAKGSLEIKLQSGQSGVPVENLYFNIELVSGDVISLLKSSSGLRGMIGGLPDLPDSKPGKIKASCRIKGTPAAPSVNCRLIDKVK